MDQYRRLSVLTPALLLYLGVGALIAPAVFTGAFADSRYLANVIGNAGGTLLISLGAVFWGVRLLQRDLTDMVSERSDASTNGIGGVLIFSPASPPERIVSAIRNSRRQIVIGIGGEHRIAFQLIDLVRTLTREASTVRTVRVGYTGRSDLGSLLKGALWEKMHLRQMDPGPWPFLIADDSLFIFLVPHERATFSALIASVTVIEYRAGSEYFLAIESHFDRAWEASGTIETGPRSAES